MGGEFFGLDGDGDECLQPPHPLPGGKGSTIIIGLINSAKLNINTWQRRVTGRLSVALAKEQLSHPWSRDVVKYLQGDTGNW